MENELKLFFWLSTFIMISLVIMVVILVIIYQKNLSKYRNEQLKEQINNNIVVEHKERTRIANELHDGLCGDLATLKNYVGVLGLTKDKELINDTLVAIHESVIMCYDEALRISYNLSPPMIEDNTISTLLQGYLIRVSRVSNVQLLFRSDKQTFEFSAIIKLEVYRIVQELIQNIIKHSKATKAQLILQWDSDQLTLFLIDDGITYDFNGDKQGVKVGLGLSNIKARIKQIKADFLHKSREGYNLVQLIIKREYDN